MGAEGLRGGAPLSTRVALRAESGPRRGYQGHGATVPIAATPERLPEGVPGYPELHFWLDAAEARIAYLLIWQEGEGREPQNALFAGALPE